MLDKILESTWLVLGVTGVIAAMIIGVIFVLWVIFETLLAWGHSRQLDKIEIIRKKSVNAAKIVEARIKTRQKPEVPARLWDDYVNYFAYGFDKEN